MEKQTEATNTALLELSKHDSALKTRHRRQTLNNDYNVASIFLALVCISLCDLRFS